MTQARGANGKTKNYPGHTTYRTKWQQHLQNFYRQGNSVKIGQRLGSPLQPLGISDPKRIGQQVFPGFTGHEREVMLNFLFTIWHRKQQAPLHRRIKELLFK